MAGLQPRVNALQGLFLSGRYQAGLALARSVAAEAMSVPYPELQAEALELQAMFEGPDRPAREATQRRVAEVAARAKDDLRGARAWVGIAIVESDKARAAEVAPTRLALEAALQRAGDPPELRGIVLQDRAYALQAMSKTDEAAELIAAIAAYGRDQKPDQVEMARAMNLRGHIAENRGNTAEALAEFERTRAIWEKHLGVDHPNVAIALNYIADCYMDMGKNAEAMAALEGARAIQERSLPPDSPVLARTLESMAHVLISDRKHDEALALLRRALAINEKLVGQDRRSLGTTARKIGDVFAQKGDIDSAIPYFARAVSVHTEVIGPESPNVASAESAWGAALRNAKRLAEARVHLERALVLRQKVHGRDNPILLHTLLHLGALARQEDRLADALALDQRSLAIAQKSWGDDNPQKASLYHAVAEDMMLLGRFGDALPLYQQGLAIQQRGLPPDHFDFGPVLIGLGECLVELGRPAEALAPLERAIRDRRADRDALGSGAPPLRAGPGAVGVGRRPGARDRAGQAGAGGVRRRRADPEAANGADPGLVRGETDLARPADTQHHPAQLAQEMRVAQPGRIALQHRRDHAIDPRRQDHRGPGRIDARRLLPVRRQQPGDELLDPPEQLRYPGVPVNPGQLAAQRRAQRRVARLRLQEAPQETLDAFLDRRPRLGQPELHAPVELLEVALEHGDDQRLLGGEVLVEQTDARAGDAGHLGGGELRVSNRHQNLSGRADQRLHRRAEHGSEPRVCAELGRGWGRIRAA